MLTLSIPGEFPRQYPVSLSGFGRKFKSPDIGYC